MMPPDQLAKEPIGEHADPLPYIWFVFKVLRKDPLITLSTTNTSAVHLVEIICRVPELFSAREGLHLLRPTWHFEKTELEPFVASLKAAMAAVPGHSFMYLANYDHEANLVAVSGMAAITANDGLFADETKWFPGTEPIANFTQHTAVYNARFDAVKRHELAAQIEKLLLIYPWSITGETSAEHSQATVLLPKATFANHKMGGGIYELLEHETVNRLYGHANVGLALSAEEGAMRASTEYLLAGLPIVSTRSTGGRDRYYGLAFVRQVSDDPEAVGAAAIELSNARLDRNRIREEFLKISRFERHNFLGSMNRIGKSLLGRDGLFPDFEPFRGSMMRYLHLRSNIEIARESAKEG